MHGSCLQGSGRATDRVEFYIKGRPRLAKPYHLSDVGLPKAYRLDGVTFADDPDYGRPTTIADIPGLHRAIGLHIIGQPGTMSGDEMRVRRKQMRMTQESLAACLWVNMQCSSGRSWMR